MEKLFMNKLQAINELSEFTKQIKELSFKADYEKISSMVIARQEYMNKVNFINEEIKEFTDSNNFQETSEIKNIKKSIKKLISDIIEMDKEIRRNLNDEMKTVKVSLNKSENQSSLLNFKA